MTEICRVFLAVCLFVGSIRKGNLSWRLWIGEWARLGGFAGGHLVTIHEEAVDYAFERTFWNRLPLENYPKVALVI